MLSNEERTWIDENWNLIKFLAEIEEKGVDIWAFVDITETLVQLLRKGKDAKVDIVPLLSFIVEQQSAESVEEVQHV